MIRPALLALPALPAVLAAAAFAQPADASLDRARYDGCVRAVATDADKALEFARQWQARGGGLPARHCAALALLRQDRFAEAAAVLEDAAAAAAAARAPQLADFWGQAGNAWFLAGDHDRARLAFDRAIEAAGPFAPQRTSALHVDRARVAADRDDTAAARADLDRALALTPEDPLALMLSASLARRAGDLARAQRDIAAASARAPGDPDVMLEQGHVALAAGDAAAARQVWQMVTRAAPGTPAAQLAATALSALSTLP